MSYLAWQLAEKSRLFETKKVPYPDLLGHVLRNENVSKEGTWLEFGVATGQTLTQLAQAKKDGRVFGFDSFDGLPEDWKPGIGKGAFKCDVPNVSGAEIIVGLFQDTLPSFKPSFDPNHSITLVHVDCDLYSSSRYVLKTLLPHLKNGTVIVFDEILFYPGHEEHELKALFETWKDGLRYEWLCHSQEKAAIRVLTDVCCCTHKLEDHYIGGCQIAECGCGQYKQQ